MKKKFIYIESGEFRVKIRKASIDFVDIRKENSKEISVSMGRKEAIFNCKSEEMALDLFAEISKKLGK